MSNLMLEMGEENEGVPRSMSGCGAAPPMGKVNFDGGVLKEVAARLGVAIVVAKGCCWCVRRTKAWVLGFFSC